MYMKKGKVRTGIKKGQNALLTGFPQVVIFLFKLLLLYVCYYNLVHTSSTTPELYKKYIFFIKLNRRIVHFCCIPNRNTKKTEYTI